MSPAVEFAFPVEASSLGFAERLAALGTARGGPTDFPGRSEALGRLSDALLARDSGLHQALPREGLAFLAAFLRTDNLRAQIAREVANLDALVRFIPLGPRKSLRLVPRGTVCHWVAGNVPLLAVFSWAFSAALGNRNVLRLSSRQGDVMSPLLSVLAKQGGAGAQIAAETLVVSFGRQDRAAHEAMSRAADVRIAWGGREAVDAIRDLPAGWDCEDVVFGPRMSFAVVDPECLSPGAVSRLATDAAIFDQLACSSPQVIYVRGEPGTSAFDGFLSSFGTAFATQAAAYPRHALDYYETYRIALDRARAVLEGGQVLHDAGTQWTIAVLERPDPQIECVNRVVQIVPFTSLDQIYPHVPRNVQTVVMQLPVELAEEFSESAARLGVCRLPRPGEGNHFENPWDGVGLVSRLTRAVVRSEAGT